MIMNYLVVAIPNDILLAEWLGKKGSVNGITFYNRRNGDNIFTIITPSCLEEKFYGLGEILTLSEAIVISTKTVDADFGEAVISALLLKKKVFLTKDNDVSGIIGNLGLDYELVEREELLGRLSDLAVLENSGEPSIPIDKMFPVKGVGIVLLGIVTRGTVNVHDKLRLSSGKELQVRSIQVQDEDAEYAGKGARVGLAVKGIDEKDLEKGEILAKEQIRALSEIEAELAFNPMNNEMSEETQYTFVSGFAVVPCKIAKKAGTTYTIKFGKAVQALKGSSFLIFRDKKPRVLCAGRIE